MEFFNGSLNVTFYTKRENPLSKGEISLKLSIGVTGTDEPMKELVLPSTPIIVESSEEFSGSYYNVTWPNLDIKKGLAIIAITRIKNHDDYPNPIYIVGINII